MKRDELRPRVTARAILLGVLLIPANAYWLVALELIWGRTFPSTVPLLSTVIVTLLLLVALNRGVYALSPRIALNRAELLTVYSMLAVATALMGTDVLQTLVHIVSTPFWYATEENEWATLFHHLLPDWLTVRDRTALQGFFLGDTTPYTWEHIRPWLRPAALWGLFVVALVYAMLCLNVLVRRRWTEHERLAYPVIELPAALVGEERGIPLFRNRLMWLGFALAGGINVVNGLNYLYPFVPFINTKGFNLGAYFTERPWSAIRWMPVTFYPFAFGIGFLMPLELAFSCWFFYLFWRFERVVGAAFGWDKLPGFPFPAAQISGVWIAVLGYLLWEGRRYFGRVLRRVASNRPLENEAREPMSYRAAIWGFLFASAFLVAFVHAAGMSIPVAAAFFTLYFGISLAITRIRAELGPPVQNLRDSGPDLLLTNAFGSRRLPKRDLSIIAMLFWINGESYRSHPMPHQLEAFKLAERARFDARRLVVALTVASFVAVVAAFWAVLVDGYTLGSMSGLRGPAARYFPLMSYRRLARWLTNPTEPNVFEMTITAGSFTATLAMLLLRAKLLWWPLHPIGLAISHAWGMNWFWFPLLVAWAVKWALLRHGGVRAYRTMLPFFLGLILGEYSVGSFWSLLGIALGRRMYAFWV